ncbi:MAG: rod shape-determining protein MreD [Dysgonamonadaceae bacterium]|jgi:rod shape-determining protein MreD|nr:rod shape-determining protein MreD [Dysgonamonadaceae bacterium]
MNKVTIQRLLLFILLVLLQVWLFNSIHLFGIATPFVYLYFILKLPVKMNRNTVLMLSALIGLIIDLFGFTLGLNMAVMVIVGFLRFYLLKLFAPRDVFEDYVPSFETLGNFMFVRYAGTMTLIHVTILHLMESFTLFDPIKLALRILGSFILTVLLIYAIESVNIGGLKK